jgi:hypothetical protein
MEKFEPVELPWKVQVNPFGKTEGDLDNIFIADSSGLVMLTVSKHPVWKHLEMQRESFAQWLVDKINSPAPPFRGDKVPDQPS